MICVRNLRLNVGEKEKKLPALAARALHIPQTQIAEWKIVKKSLDARKKTDIHWRYTVACAVPDEEAEFDSPY